MEKIAWSVSDTGRTMNRLENSISIFMGSMNLASTRYEYPLIYFLLPTNEIRYF